MPRKIEELLIKSNPRELWEKEPHKIPLCGLSSAAQSKKSFYDANYPDENCMKCHSNKDLAKVVDGEKNHCSLILINLKFCS